jgi:hypothetical protein
VENERKIKGLKEEKPEAEVDLEVPGVLRLAGLTMPRLADQQKGRRKHFVCFVFPPEFGG